MSRSFTRPRLNPEARPFGSYTKEHNEILNMDVYYSEIKSSCDSIKDHLHGIKANCYLDIGCGDGKITQEIAAVLGLNPLQTHGVDIVACKNPAVTYSKYDEITLPFSDNSFDFITTRSDVKMVTEIFRVLKPLGIVMSVGLRDVEPFKSAGFEVTEQSNIFRFIKPEVKHDVMQLVRKLNDDIPRELYKRRTKEVKNVLHWGQRKLLLTEIEFLTLFLESYDGEKPVYVIYAGSAPGTHIVYLSRLFPRVMFILYDPREFSNKLRNEPMIKTFVQYFTDETAREWIAGNHPDKTILLVSDIRTGEPETQTQEMVEERVGIDHIWQQTWYHIMTPEMAMFKFRLPWNDSKTEYLDGDIYIQPYPPPTSTETRLIVGKNAKTRMYDNRKYEEQLFHFNNHIRPRSFANILFDIDPTKKYGMSNDYDNSSEVYILERYLKMRDEKNIKQSIIKMINEINKELSYTRTLKTSQPVKEHKKKFMINLKKLGYIPNVELNHYAFNTYVIPRYDYFVSMGLIPK